MDEYLNYLNTIKNFQHNENYHGNQSNYHPYNNINERERENRDRDSHGYNKDRRHYQNHRNNPSDIHLKKKRLLIKDYKDLDEIETQQSSQNNQNNRNLISYDDL